MGDKLKLTIKGREFSVDWDKGRDPTPDEVAAISKAIAAREFPAPPGKAKGEVYGPPAPKQLAQPEWLRPKAPVTPSVPTQPQRQDLIDVLSTMTGASRERIARKPSPGELKARAERERKDREARERQSRLDKLPFTVAAIRRAVDLGLSGVETKTGGYVSMRVALANWHRATGETSVEGSNPYALDDPKLYAFDLAGKADPEALIRATGKPYVPSIVENPERGEPMLTNLPSKLVKNVTRGIAEKHKNLSRQEIDELVRQAGDSREAKVGDTVFNFAKYLVPGLNTAAGVEDAGALVARSQEVGPLQAGGEMLEGILRGANVFEPGIDPAERVARGLNALLLGLGVTAGARKAFTRGQDALVVKELARKTGKSEAEVRSTLGEMRKQVAQQAHDAAWGTQQVLSDAKPGGSQPRTKRRATGALPAPPTVDAKGRPGRILPDPIVGKKPKSPRQILDDAMRDLGRVFTGKPDSRRAYGTYKPGNMRTTIARFADLDTAVHELSHRIDDEFGLISGYGAKRQRSPFDSELFQPELLHTTSRRYTLAQKRLEATAEFLRLYAINPSEAKRLTPSFHSYFERTVPANVRGALRRFGDDIRVYAGASNVEKVAANIVFDDPGRVTRANVVDRVRGFLGVGQNYYRTSGVSRVKAAVTDSLDPLVKATEEAMRRRGLGELLPSKDPRTLATAHAYVTNKVDQILTGGMVNHRNETVGRPFAEILEALDTTTKDSLERDVRDMLAFMVSERQIEKSLLKGDDAITNLGGGIYSNDAVAAQAIQEISKDPARLARIQEAAKRYREHADKLLRYAVAKGRLTTDDYLRIRSQNEYYVALNRIVDDSPDAKRYYGRGLASRQEVARGLKGSGREIQDPLVSLLEQTFVVVKESDRNEVMSKLADLLDGDGRGMHQGEAVDLASIGHKVPATQKSGGELVTIYRGGKPERWWFEEGLRNSLQGVGTVVQFGHPAIDKAITFLPDLVRAAITRSPGFFGRNIQRDTLSRLVLSRDGSGIKDMLRRATPDELSDYKLYGGGMSRSDYLEGAVSYYRVQRKMMDEAAKDPGSVLLVPGKWLKGGVDKYLGAIESGERANRLAEYRKAFDSAKRKGMSDYDAKLYAAEQSRELLDFARSGYAVRWANRLVPFLNASIQGTSRTFTAFAEASGPGKAKIAGKMATRVAMVVGVPTLAQRMWNASMGAEDEYLQLPLHVRTQFWNVKLPDGTWARVPKPFELGSLSTAFERAVDEIRGKGDGWEGLPEQLFEQMNPVKREVTTGGAYTPLFESAFNRDTFRNRDIVSAHERDQALELREGAKRASTLGQVLQQVFRTDARYMDHYVESFGGDFGRVAIAASDIGRKDKLVPGSRLLQATTGMNMEPAGPSSVDAGWVLDRAKELGVRQTEFDAGFQEALRAYWDAKTEQRKYAAAARVRAAATRLRSRMERASKGKSGTKRLDAMRSVLRGR